MSRRGRKALVIGAVVFLLGAVDAYLSGNVLVAAASVVMAGCNLLALVLVERSPQIVQLALFVLNAATALLVAYTTWQAGKEKLPYAWVLAAVTFLIAGWRRHGRGAFNELRATGETDPAG
jgi:hypothetical protein